MSDEPIQDPCAGDEPEPSDSTDASMRATLQRFVPRPELSEAASYVRGLFVREKMFEETPRIDRYELVRVIGEGGMGVVVLARDPNFASEVAIKVLDGRFEESGEPGEARARGEWLKQVHHEAMQLMAVRGPHVVGVFNAGIVEGLRWLAMEYVEGEDLERWLEAVARPLPWQTIVARFVDAARGLQSVHAAGLVHRDFKPRNAVLDRKRDRVCVIDFGLVTDASMLDEMRAEGRLLAEEAVTRSSGSRPRRSSLFAAAGTPMFMSPEQSQYERLDARSDQFSFCLSLYWALYGEVPFAGAESTAEEVVRLGRAGQRVRLPRPRPRHADAVPRWLHALLEKGMACAPEERHASMEVIIAELTRDRRRELRVVATLVTVFVVALVVGAGLVPWVQSQSCQARGAEVHEALALRLPELQERYEEEVWGGLLGFTERWAGRWKASCEGHFVRGEPGIEARQQCLQREGRELKYLLDALVVSEVPAVRAKEAVRGMGDPAVCDAAGLNRAKPVGSHQREAVEAIEEELAAARAGQWVGDYEAAQVHAEAARAAARSLGHAPTLARAEALVGEVGRVRGEVAAAQQALISAYEAAIAGRDVFMAIMTMHELVRLALKDQRDEAGGAGALQRAVAHLADLEWHTRPGCVPIVDAECVQHGRLWAEHQDLEGLLAHLRVEYEDSWKLHDEAVAQWRLLGEIEDTRAQLSRTLINRGRSAMARGERAAARADFAEGRALIEALGGGDLYGVEVQLYNMAILAREEGDFDAALVDAAAARELQREFAGESSLGVAEADLLLAVILLDKEDFERAREQAERALKLAVELKEGREIELSALQVMAGVMKESGDRSSAAERYKELARRRSEQAGAEGRCDAALMWVEVGRCLPAEAHAAWERAEELLVGLPECSSRFELLRARGELAAAEGNHVKALGYFDGAAAAPELPRAIVAEIQWYRARSMVVAGRDRGAAREQAVLARSFYAAQGERKKVVVEVIDQWLAVH